MSSKLTSFINQHYLAIMVVLFSFTGFVAAFTLSFDKLVILRDVGKSLNCDLNSVFSCGIVMRSSYSEIFGIPWSFLGMAGYPAAGLVGLMLIERKTMSRWMTIVTTLPVFGAFALSTYFMWITAYVIGVFCPWCVVSAISATLVFFILLIHHFKQNNFGLSESVSGRINQRLQQGWGILFIIGWFVMMILLEVFPFVFVYR